MSRIQQPGWVLRVVPGPEESFGHYLSRFRHANCLSRKTLAEELDVPTKIASDWEVPSRRRVPDPAQLERLSQLVGISSACLRQMFPPAQLHLRTRLCPACYAENPVHRVSWQHQGIAQCYRHKIELLSACPVCGTGFRTPALWNNEPCQGCGLPFEQMAASHVTGDKERA